MTFQIEINGLPVSAVFSEENIEGIFLPLLKRLTEIQNALGRRILVFLAAPPGAGKSTLSEFLRHLSVNTPEVTPITVIGMDGFHRRQEYLISHTAVRDGKEIPMVGIFSTIVCSALPRERTSNGRIMTGPFIIRSTGAAASRGTSCCWKGITCCWTKMDGGI